MYNSYFGFQETPFSVNPDPRFFYTNPLYQEALATLGSGIESKKGLIVITGEVGTGKTTLLRKLMRSFEANTHSVFVFNTHLDFTELLQLIAHDLGLVPRRRDRLTLLEELDRYLIRQHKKGHIVCLLIDEAQNLSNKVLDRLRLLTHPDSGHALQIVLMGQPELEKKLNQPALSRLRQRVAAHCRLAPLNEREVLPYIAFRLQAAGYKGEGLFHLEAVEQIAFSSKGIPRLINIICDNALLLAYASCEKKVAAGMVQEVVRDLRLEEEPEVKPENRTTELVVTESPEEVAEATKDEGIGGIAQTTLKQAEMRVGRMFMRARRAGLAVEAAGILLAFLLLGGAVALYPQQTTQETDARAPLTEARARQDYALLAEDLGPAGSSLPGTEHPSESSPSTSSAGSPEPASPERLARIQTSGNREINRKNMQLQIDKAIHKRAITGIEVSLKDGVAYLDGRVKTEGQKLAAERAARSVPAVKQVRNRIIVSSLPPVERTRRVIQRIQVYVQ